MCKNLSSVKSRCVGVNAGTLPVMQSEPSAAAVDRAGGRDLAEAKLDADEHDAALACERWERERAEQEEGLEGDRRLRGGSMRREE